MLEADYMTVGGMMKKLIAAMIVVIGSNAHGAPPAVSVSVGGDEPTRTIEERYAYVGFTTVQKNGFVWSAEDNLLGRVVMNRLCEARFGKRARAATTADLDYIEGPLPDVNSKQRVWVVPVYPITVFPSAIGTYDAFDAVGTPLASSQDSPASAVRSADCRRYSSGSGGGIAFGASGEDGLYRIEQASCAIERPIACSAPAGSIRR